MYEQFDSSLIAKAAQKRKQEEILERVEFGKTVNKLLAEYIDGRMKFNDLPPPVQMVVNYQTERLKFDVKQNMFQKKRWFWE